MSLGIAARLKLRAKKAKVAIIEKSMTGEEKDKLKDYIKMVAGLHSVHDVQTLLELEKEHDQPIFGYFFSVHCILQQRDNGDHDNILWCMYQEDTIQCHK